MQHEIDRNTGDDKFACFVCNLNLAGLTGTKIILWLVAITIVSFVIGFGILAVSGDLPASSENQGIAVPACPHARPEYNDNYP